MGPVDSRVVVFDKVSTANGIVPFIADMANINLGVVVLGAKKNSALHQRVGQAEHDQSSSFRRGRGYTSAGVTQDQSTLAFGN